MKVGDYVLFPLNSDPMSRARVRAPIVAMSGGQVTVSYQGENRTFWMQECVAIA